MVDERKSVTINKAGNIRNFLRGLRVTRIRHSTSGGLTSTWYQMDFKGSSQTSKALFYDNRFTVRDVEVNLRHICSARVAFLGYGCEAAWDLLGDEGKRLVETVALATYEMIVEYCRKNRHIFEKEVAASLRAMKRTRLTELHLSLLRFHDLEEEEVLSVFREVKIEKVLKS